MDLLTALQQIVKHLPGQHSQATHGKGGSGAGAAANTANSSDVMAGVKVHRKLNKYDLDVVADDADKTMPVHGVSLDAANAKKLAANVNKAGWMQIGSGAGWINNWTSPEGQSLRIVNAEGARHAIFYYSKYRQQAED